eukprot:CAMPEP_0196573098 /NCGR_PEP_ID=MMETSP1081-20130531/3050_1 /TAXON_ID=36882 /ORGANISM="Pyramimonas amylifera, Strain CCMP720" /LENGTH=72 /DNA_ID=CAMNT_0041890685 /DNA_START=210 /DNA_END=428 /DNA_ORIENTATION=+
MTFFEAVQVRDKLKQNGEIINKLAGRYVQKDGKEFVCSACKMFLLNSDVAHVTEHFAFQHTGEMARLLKDDQ